jgi:hypothetical protein
MPRWCVRRSAARLRPLRTYRVIGELAQARPNLATIAQEDNVLAYSMSEQEFVLEHFLDDGTYLFPDLDITGLTECASFPPVLTQQALIALWNVDTGTIVALSGINDCGNSPVCGSNPGTFAYGNTGNFDARYLSVFLAPPGVTFDFAPPECELGIGGGSLTCNVHVFFPLP